MHQFSRIDSNNTYVLPVPIDGLCFDWTIVSICNYPSKGN